MTIVQKNIKAKRKSNKQRAPLGAPTLADVARAAGVSPMTVSRVMNDGSKVRIQTREKVEAAIAKLRYTPNRAAQSLAGAGTLRIALLYSNPSAAYLSRFLLGGLEQARHSDTQLLLENCSNAKEAVKLIDALIASGAKGIILSPPLCDDPTLLKHLETHDIAACIVANWRPKGSFDVIRIDDIKAACEMTSHLIKQGHRRIAFIKGDPAHRAAEQRYTGYCKALDKAGINIDPQLIIDGLFTFQSGMHAAEELLSLSVPPTAIFASNDDMAAAAITVAQRLHFIVPDDISICGFDDTDFASSIWPELTTIHQPIADMARIAVDILTQNIRNPENPKGETVLPYRLIKRGSDSPLKLDKQL